MLADDMAALNARFFEAFDPDISELPILVDNQPDQPLDETQPWCRWSIQPGGCEQDTTGPRPIYKQIGQAYLQIFMPKGTGTGAAYDIRDRFEVQFRSWRSPDNQLRVLRIDNELIPSAGYQTLVCRIEWKSLRKPPLGN